MSRWICAPGGALLLLLTFAVGAGAQGPLSLEVRGGGSWPANDFRSPVGSTGELEADAAFGVDFALERGLGFAFVIGFSQYRVRCPAAGCGVEESWISTQWRLGTRWTPFDAAVAPWLEAIAIIPRVERKGGAAETSSDTSFGLEGGVGLRVRIARRWSLVPAVRWTDFEADFDGSSLVPMTFLSGTLGLRVAF